MLAGLKNLKLSSKALLATMVPFVINVGWLIAMWSNSVQIEHLAELERRQSALVENVNQLIHLYSESQGSFITAFYTGNQWRVDGFLASVKECRDMELLLLADTSLLPVQKSELRELEKFAAFQADFLKENGGGGNEDKWHEFVQHRKVFNAMLKGKFQNQNDYRNFLLPQRTELEHLREKQKKQQQIFMLLLVTGVTSNLLIAIFFHYLFGRHVTRQVKTLVSNARALSNKQVMLEPLGGKDDFAVIDAALHKSEKKLAAAVEYRQALMQMLAHDLKSPLAASQVSLALILERERGALTERGITLLNGVTSNNKRLLALISDLLTVDAFEAGHLDLTVKQASIAGCVNEAIDTLSGLATIKSIKIATRFDCQDGYFDYQRILQVLVNLLSNAIKFSKKGSEISIECENFATREIKVSIIDHGAGIADKDKARIFERYYMTEAGKEANGTGLGLAISKFIVEAHEEKISFGTTPGGGTTFWFTVKRA